jgi:putative salt-induced outer membrane protein YdiY
VRSPVIVRARPNFNLFGGTAVMAIVLVLATAGRAAADEVWLLNGDSFSGAAQSLENGVLTFRTPFADAFKVPWKQVAGLETAREVRVTVRDRGWRIARVVPGPPGSLRLLTDVGVSDDVLVGDVVRIVRPQSGVLMTSRAEAGGLLTSGSSDVSSLHVAGAVAWRTVTHLTSADININRTETAGIQTTSNFTATARHQEFLTDHIYANGNLIVTNDVVRDLASRVAPGIGIGYQFLRYGVTSFSIDGGGGYVNERHYIETDRSYWAARETLKFDWFIVPTRLQVYHQQDGYFGLTGGENQFIQTRSGLRFTLVGGLIMSAELGVNYDRRPALGQAPIDRTFAINLGYQMGF